MWPGGSYTNELNNAFQVRKPGNVQRPECSGRRTTSRSSGLRRTTGQRDDNNQGDVTDVDFEEVK